MMYTPFKILLGASLLAVFLLSACAKESPAPSDPNAPVTPLVTGSFNWIVNGGTSVSADNFFFIESFSNIVGTKNSGSISVDISLDALSVGSHTISPSSGITFDYSNGTSVVAAKSGIVTISSKTSSYLSGTYVAAFNTGTLTSMSGSFSNLPSKK